MEDAILTVSRYYGTPEDVGFTKHALFSEALNDGSRPGAWGKIQPG
jgi:hypothetical protein